ncbi:uncharacterized protein [Dysidea avara]|uniref:uncharacterized protein isoform X2 n=1 Tax=Dysidea avara TaxID=196820 RepID=UPI0033186781
MGVCPTSLLLLAAAVEQVAAQSQCTDESCKVDNTARLTWTLLGVLLIINLLLFCMLTCTWYYLFTRIRDLRRQIKYNRPKRGGIVDCHVDANRHPFHGAGYDRRPSSVPLEYFPISDHDAVTADSGIRNSQDTKYSLDVYRSQDVIQTSQNVRKSESTHGSQDVRGSNEFDDYSTVVDAVPDSPPDGVIRTIPKPSTSRMNKAPNTSTRKNKITHTEESTARKMARQHKRQRQIHHTTPDDKPPTDSQRTKSDSADHYSHIIDGLSPVGRESTVFVDAINPPDDSTNPPAAKKPAAARPDSQLQEDSLATQDFVPERDGFVYSTPYPGGVQNFRRMTVSKCTPQSQEELDRDDDEHPIVRPKSALGLYPLDLTSANTSPSSSLDGRRKKKKDQHLRPVSAYYNDPV